MVGCNRRILVIDDMESIHQDFRKILGPPASPDGLADLERGLFGEPVRGAAPAAPAFELTFASQGLEGVERVRAAMACGAAPFAVAFVDVRMPPGLDGVETVVRLWEIDPRIEVVVCTAYSDYSWAQMLGRLVRAGQFLVLGKPFDSTAVRQMALALTEKWNLARAAERSEAELEELVALRTQELTGARRALEQELAERKEMERQLVQAQKLEGLGRLVAGVAHEVNNPLSFVLANLDHLASELRDAVEGWGERARELLDVADEARTGGRRIRQIVQDLTSFSRPDHLAPEDVALEDVLRFALRMAGPALPDETCVTTDFAPVPPVRAGRGLLSQVFLNLFVNAGHAMEALPPARRQLAVALARADEGHVRVRVRDTGVGIVKRLDGDIQIASEQGAWTEVVVTLPVLAASSGGRASAEEPAQVS